MNISDSQGLLGLLGVYDGDIDGDWGPKSRQAAEKVLNSTFSSSPDKIKSWSTERKRIAASQVALDFLGYLSTSPIDGLFGPMTQHALNEWNHIKIYNARSPRWRDDLIADMPSSSELEKAYGSPGGVQCSSGKIKLPFPMKLSWDKQTTITTISCHEKIADSATRIYNKIASAYSSEDISRFGFDLFGGCYNYRKARGASFLSTHAYGIAIDHDPERNQLKWGKTRAFLARPECREFWDIWESEGWISLGRARNYDWMHVQAAKP